MLASWMQSQWLFAEENIGNVDKAFGRVWFHLHDQVSPIRKRYSFILLTLTET